MIECDVAGCDDEPVSAYELSNKIIVCFCSSHEPRERYGIMRKVNWNEEEQKTMQRLSMQRNSRSGGGPLFKEDGRSSRLLAQQKGTQGKAIALKLQDWKDLVRHADEEKKTPMFILKFVDGPELICLLPEHIEEVYKHFFEAGMIEIVEAVEYQDEQDPAESLRKLF